LSKTDQTGLVVKTQSGFYTVQTDSALVTCQLRGTLKQASKKTELCVIGDRVTVGVLRDGTGVIKAIAPRERVLSRVEPSDYAGTSTEREQVIIANLDQAMFVFSATRPDPRLRMLDRFLVVAEKAGAPSIVIVVNKIDLDEQKARTTFTLYERIGYPVLYTSAETGAGIAALRETLQGKISVFTGPSGVGKSSLLNVVQPGLGRTVQEVRDRVPKGRHTTVSAELIPLEGGGYVADTPGLRQVAPWDVEPGELDAYFAEIHPHVAECRFSDCTHTHEPACGVRAAVEAGAISPERYESYLRLREELEEQFVY
jgi:ribosome biogenesis GTPase